MHWDAAQCTFKMLLMLLWFHHKCGKRSSLRLWPEIFKTSSCASTLILNPPLWHKYSCSRKILNVHSATSWHIFNANRATLGTSIAWLEQEKNAPNWESANPPQMHLSFELPSRNKGFMLMLLLEYSNKYKIKKVNSYDFGAYKIKERV